MPLPRAPGVNTPIGDIASIQRGVTFVPVATVETLVTITAVNPAKSNVRYLNRRTFPNNPGNEWSSVQSNNLIIDLRDATTIRIRHYLGNPAHSSSQVSWEVTEYQ